MTFLKLQNWRGQIIQRLCFAASLFGLSTAALLGRGTAAIAAERIEFFIGPFEPVIWIEDLAIFAADGTVTERLAPIANGPRARF